MKLEIQEIKEIKPSEIESINHATKDFKKKEIVFWINYVIKSLSHKT